MNEYKKITLVKQEIAFWKQVLLYVSMICLFVTILVKIINIQGFNTDYFTNLSIDNHKRYISINCPRGTIFDRNGKELATDLPTFDLYISPTMIKDTDSFTDILTSCIDLDKTKLNKILSEKDLNNDSYLIKSNLSSEEIARFNELSFNLKGATIEESYKRYYPNGKTLAHVLGYTGLASSSELEIYNNLTLNERVGKSGIEKYYENLIHGEKGKIVQIVSANGKVLDEMEEKPSKKGENIFLTIDLNLQKKVEEVIGDNYGTGIIIDAKKGEILACASNPSFDPNIFSKDISYEEWQSLSNKRAFFNIAIQGVYPPGSTFKPLISLYALSRDIINLETKYLCSGSLNIKGMEEKYKCWVFPSSHGWLNLKDALKYSCDIFFYQLARDFKFENFIDFAIKFGGITKKTGIDLPYEDEGFLGSPTWKKKYIGDEWFEGDSMNIGIGQGYILVTPLQMSKLYLKIANRGKEVVPHLLLKTESNKTFYNYYDIKEENYPIENKYCDIIIDYLKGVTEVGGTAYGLNVDGVKVAAKTGTAEGPNGEHLWLISIFPADDPQIVALIMFENSKYEFASELTPYMKNILLYYKNEYNTNKR
ncbi:MAG TPA: penicillin-binding protein 2 [Caldisericia bacterium]|nr:penicillin-binding protein 2 [Caldisericia bacterium]